jgi:hypothetical protein|tara:strand:+ start:715 stop:1257 length:543 start_codon:yes stop_codon:yes gene_type:complete
MALSVNDFTAGDVITASAMNTNFATIENYVNSSPGLAALTGATFSGLVTANGGITAAGTTTVAALTASGIVDVTNTTDASDATGDTGALRCEGGASIAKKLYVGTDLDVDGTTNLDAVDVDGNFTLDGNVAGANSITRIAYSHSGAATVASNQVNSTPTIFVCTSEPTATSNGDIWIDIS